MTPRTIADGAGRSLVVPADGVIAWITGVGQVLTRVHERATCTGEHCVVHDPSDHHMREWPTLFRRDRGITERICPHGIGHPDPDDPTDDRTHGCDGCCVPPGEVAA